ncbi:Electron transport complex subunit RsxC [bioreactor metagenome]|uniref:Electron transport complex subunit RsxC n=1 Tax=bioreactor metagenome TaxID=1076179 RepID=A0A645CIP4_9ZZZZ
MGKLVTDLSQPITKTTKGLIVLPAEHSIITRRRLPVNTMTRRAKTACVQCRQCTDLCPRFLLGHSIEPHKIMRAFKHSGSHEQVVRMALTCSECGACEYACIMGLSPRTANVMLKQELSRLGITPNAPPLIQRPSNMRSERRLPVNRLIARLGLTKYNKSAPLTNECYEISKVRIKLKQHIGTPSRSLVTSGQWVEQGELIAEIPDNSLGANIHASISGFVAAVTDAVTIVSPPKCIN